MEVNEKLLSSLPFRERLTESETDKIIKSAVLRHCRSGETICGYGSACLGMIMIIKGGLRAFLLSEGGREITLFRLGAGEICVLSASCVISRITFDTNIVAELESELLIIPSSVFSELAEKNIYVRCFMYEKMTERFSSVISTMQQLVFMRIDSRLASFLVSECERSGSDEINMTHELIAQHISSAREVVARTLKRFAGDGLIEMKRGLIQVTDMNGLKGLISDSR